MQVCAYVDDKGLKLAAMLAVERSESCFEEIDYS